MPTGRLECLDSVFLLIKPFSDTLSNLLYLGWAALLIFLNLSSQDDNYGDMPAVSKSSPCCLGARKLTTHIVIGKLLLSFLM